MLLYIVVALVKLFVFHSCTIDVFLRYVRIKKFIIIIIIIIIIEHEPARVLRINYIHPPLIRRVYAECSPLLQLIKLINDLINDESDTILQQIEMRNNSYRTFSYNVSRLYLNTYDPVCPIGIKTCYVCQLEAQHL